RLIGLIELGDAPGIQHEFRCCEHLATEIKIPYLLWIVATLRGCLALLEGRVQEVEPLAQEALTLGKRAQVKHAALFFAVQLGHLRQLEGRFQEIEPHNIRLDRLYPLLTHGHRASLAHLYAEQGRLEDALAEFEALAANGFADLPQHVGWLCTVAFLAEVCAFLGDAPRAALIYDML